MWQNEILNFYRLVRVVAATEDTEGVWVVGVVCGILIIWGGFYILQLHINYTWYIFKAYSDTFRDNVSKFCCLKAFDSTFNL